MVNGPSPGPPPAPQARASNSRLTRSSWRAWPQPKLRRNVPRVDGAFTTQPSTRAVLPARNTIPVVNAVATGQRRGHQRMILSPGLAAPGARPVQVQVPINQLGRPRCSASVTGRISPIVGVVIPLAKGRSRMPVGVIHRQQQRELRCPLPPAIGLIASKPLSRSNGALSYRHSARPPQSMLRRTATAWAVQPSGYQYAP